MSLIPTVHVLKVKHTCVMEQDDGLKHPAAPPLKGSNEQNDFSLIQMSSYETGCSLPTEPFIKAEFIFPFFKPFSLLTDKLHFVSKILKLV